MLLSAADKAGAAASSTLGVNDEVTALFINEASGAALISAASGIRGVREAATWYRVDCDLVCRVVGVMVVVTVKARAGVGVGAGADVQREGEGLMEVFGHLSRGVGVWICGYRGRELKRGWHEGKGQGVDADEGEDKDDW